MSRLRFFAMRTVQTIFMLWIVITFLFFLFRLMPGDFTDIMLHDGASPEAVARFTAEWGLDQPLYVQYYQYLINFVVLDVGTSIQFRTPVFDFVKMRIFNTLILAVPAITTGYIVATLFGSLLGQKRGTRFEKVGIVGLISIGAFPGFVLGIFGIIVFSIYLGLVPSSGMIPSAVYAEHADAPWWRPYLTTAFFHRYILPFFVVAFATGFVGPTLIMRTSIVEVKGQDFMYYQKVSGLPYRKRLRNLAKHSIIPVITLYPISLAQAISGLVIIELIFNWPGIGFALVQAVLARDFPVAMFVFFVVAAAVIVANFLVDIIYGVIDPRISVETAD